jgi:hypothetical protein
MSLKISIVKYEYFRIFRSTILTTENLSILLNRAYQIVLGTTIRVLEQVPERIRAVITRT